MFRSKSLPASPRYSYCEAGKGDLEGCIFPLASNLERGIKGVRFFEIIKLIYSSPPKQIKSNNVVIIRESRYKSIAQNSQLC